MSRPLVLALLVALLAGCAGGPRAPEPAFYRLGELPQGPVLQAPWVEGVVLVRPLAAEGLLRERAVVYQAEDSGVTLQQHHYHHWSDTPPRLLQQRLVEFLRARGAAVLVTSDPTVEADLQVAGRLLHWERELRGQRCTVRVALELQLRAEGEPAPTLARTYQAAVPVDTLAMPESVLAFGAAVDGILEQFLLEADEALRERAPQASPSAGAR